MSKMCMDMASASVKLLSSSAFECKSSRITTQGCLISALSLRFSHPSFPRSLISHAIKAPRVRALVEEEPSSSIEEAACELYVCNIPRSCDESQLQHMFNPYGHVQSLQISRNLETGISKGCGYVTMSSMNEGITAVIALDESDVGGREMRVKFRDHMNKKKNMEIFDSLANKSAIFETPHKLYVGNLVWSIKSEILRDHFSQYGTVVSVRVIHDRKGGNSRVYGFISFSSDDELKAAMSCNGMELLGRKMVVRNALRRALTSSVACKVWSVF